MVAPARLEIAADPVPGAVDEHRSTRLHLGELGPGEVAATERRRRSGRAETKSARCSRQSTSSTFVKVANRKTLRSAMQSRNRDVAQDGATEHAGRSPGSRSARPATARSASSVRLARSQRSNTTSTTRDLVEPPVGQPAVVEPALVDVDQPDGSGRQVDPAEVQAAQQGLVAQVVGRQRCRPQRRREPRGDRLAHAGWRHAMVGRRHAGTLGAGRAGLSRAPVTVACHDVRTPGDPVPWRTTMPDGQRHDRGRAGLLPRPVRRP